MNIIILYALVEYLGIYGKYVIKLNGRSKSSPKQQKSSQEEAISHDY
jgi:hypothetical protein